MQFGQVHHIEYYVNDLKQSNEFWSWLFPQLGYRKVSEWSEGVSWAHSSGTYLVFVQVQEPYLAHQNNRQASGLNHIAFQGGDKAQVMKLKNALQGKEISITFEDESQICFVDPNGFAVEIYIDQKASS